MLPETTPERLQAAMADFDRTVRNAPEWQGWKDNRPQVRDPKRPEAVPGEEDRLHGHGTAGLGVQRRRRHEPVSSAVRLEVLPLRPIGALRPADDSGQALDATFSVLE